MSDTRRQQPTPGAGPGTVPLGVGEPFAPPMPFDVQVPQGTSPQFRDYPRLVFSAPYFTQNPLAEMFAPAVYEAGTQVIPGILQNSNLLQNAVNQAVQQLAVLRHGDTMTGPLFFADPLPTQDNQAATKLYVDMMLAGGGGGGGIAEVPLFPTNEIWARVVGAWLPISSLLGGGGGGGDGLSLPLTGGTMLGSINMNGSSIDNLGPVPSMPNGAAPASWVLEEIAAQSLYQGTWVAAANNPNLALPSYQQNAFMWIVITPDYTQPFTINAVVPGLQGQSVFNGDHIIWSTTAGRFDIIKGSSISLNEAQSMFLSLSGGNMLGPMTLSGDGTTNLSPVTLQQLNNAGASVGTSAPTAPAAGKLWWDQAGAQLYLWTGQQWVVTVNPPIPDVRAILNSSPTITTPRINGVTNGSNANPGEVGEYLEVIAPAGVNLPIQTTQSAMTATWTTIAQLNLSAGDWDVSANAAWGQPTVNPPADTSIEQQALMSTSGSGAPDPNRWPQAWIFVPTVFYNATWGTNPCVSVGTQRFSSATPFTVYLRSAVINGWGAAATVGGFGAMVARRVR